MKKQPNNRFQRLRTKFLFFCVIPASIILLALGVISIVMTIQSATINVNRSLNGQAQSKIINLSYQISSMMEKFDVDSFAEEYAHNYLQDTDKKEITEKLDYISNNSIFVSSTWIINFNTNEVFADSEADQEELRGDYKKNTGIKKTRFQMVFHTLLQVK